MIAPAGKLPALPGDGRPLVGVVVCEYGSDASRCGRSVADHAGSPHHAAMSYVSPMRSRRLPFWVVTVSLVVCALGGVFALLWFKLPTWAPAWVVAHSPWVDPIVRAVEEHPDQEDDASVVLKAWGPSVIPNMSRYLHAGAPSVRRFAALYLRRNDGDAAVDILLSYIQDSDPEVIDHVLATLEQEGRRAVLQKQRTALVPILIEHLAHAQSSVRRRAAKLLGMLKEPAAVEALSRQLRRGQAKDQEELEVQREMINALGEMGEGVAIKPLVSLIMGVQYGGAEMDLDFSQSAVMPVIAALGKLPAGQVAEVILPLPQRFEDDGWKFDVAGFVDDVRVMMALDEAMRLPEPTEKVDWDRYFSGGRGAVAASTLAKSKHPDGVRLLLQALQDPIPLIRSRAVLGIAQTFGHGVDRRLIQAVQDALSDPVDEVRFSAAFSYRYLARHLSPKPVEGLLITMTFALKPQHKRAAIEALGSPEVSDEAVRRIIDCTLDEEEKTRRVAWGTLRKTKSPRIVKAAADGYHSADAKQRVWFVQTLLTADTPLEPDKVALIRQAAADADPQVKKAFALVKPLMALTDEAIRQMVEAQ